MRRFFYDCEFLENGSTIDLISLGVVADDGREMYVVNEAIKDDEKLYDRIRRHHWLMDNVIPHLPLRPNSKVEPAHRSNSGGWFALDDNDNTVMPLRMIRNVVREFLLEGNPDRDWRQTELWAWYGAYDHVALAQLFGPMIRLPKGIPMWTNDVQQEAWRLGVDVEAAVPPVGDAHNALDDARRTKAMWEHLREHSSAR